MVRTQAERNRNIEQIRQHRENNPLERTFRFDKGSGQVKPLGSETKTSGFQKFMQMARRLFSGLPKFSAGPKGRTLSIPGRQKSVQKTLMPENQRPHPKQLKNDVREAILKKLTSNNQSDKKVVLDKAACAKILADDALMPRLYQIQRHGKPIVFSSPENVGLQKDGTIVVQGYHLSADKRSGQAEDLHDTLRRVVGLPPAESAGETRTAEPPLNMGAAGNRNHVPDEIVDRRVKDTIIFKAFGADATKLPTQARVAIRNDDQLMHFIELSSRNDNGGIIFSDAKEPGLYPDEGVFVSTYHLDGGNADNQKKDLYTQLREAFGLHLDDDPEAALSDVLGDRVNQLSEQARTAIYDDHDLLRYLRLLANNDTDNIIFTDESKKGYFPGEGVFVSADHLDPNNEGRGGKDLRTELREAFALDVSVEDEKAAASTV
ncbi:MAG: hypothetical protein AAFQ09_05780 [Pseudomonadota bacterium]